MDIIICYKYTIKLLVMILSKRSKLPLLYFCLERYEIA